MPYEPKASDTVEFIRIHRFPVMVDFEQLPLFPNHIHVLTKPKLIEREVLLKKGQEFSSTAIAETVRNLRSLGIFAVVAALPVRDRDSGAPG